MLSSLKQNDMLEEVKDVNQVPSVLAELDVSMIALRCFLGFVVGFGVPRNRCFCSVGPPRTELPRRRDAVYCCDSRARAGIMVAVTK